MNTMQEAFANYDSSQLPDAIAEIKKNDGQISGGRTIVNVKSNQLFTGQFEKSDLDEFVYIWNQYKRNTRMPLKAHLMNQARAMIRNYHSEVCPIEVMLYTSNVVASMFVNKRLLADVAEVVYLIFKENESFMRSIEHILKVWRFWDQAINACEITVGKIAAERTNDEDTELLRYIYNNFHYQEEVNYGCFCALIESKKEEFVVDILSMIRDLNGTDADKQIGNVFKKRFGVNFPDYYNRLNSKDFSNSGTYVQELIRNMLDPKRNGNMINQYKEAKNKEERKYLVDIALNRVLKDDRSGSPYEAINVLKLATSETISEQLFLNFNNRKKQRSVDLTTAVICNYFGSINYPPAIQEFMKIGASNDYYAAIRIALFFQDKISADKIAEEFLSENKPDQIKMYLNGFFGLQERLPAVRAGTINYLSKNLSDQQLSTAIMNYYRLIQKYRHLYDPQVGGFIKTWFGYGTIWNTIQLGIQDQMTCLNIIKLIINDSNHDVYEDFLYYIAEEGMDFSPAVSNLAKQILKDLHIINIRG